LGTIAAVEAIPVAVAIPLAGYVWKKRTSPAAIAARRAKSRWRAEQKSRRRRESARRRLTVAAGRVESEFPVLSINIAATDVEKAGSVVADIVSTMSEGRQTDISKEGANVLRRCQSASQRAVTLARNCRRYRATPDADCVIRWNLGMRILADVRALGEDAKRLQKDVEQYLAGEQSASELVAALARLRPTPVLTLAYRSRQLQDSSRNLGRQAQGFEFEMLPYNVNDTVELASNLSSRINQFLTTANGSVSLDPDGHPIGELESASLTLDSLRKALRDEMSTVRQAAGST